MYVPKILLLVRDAQSGQQLGSCELVQICDFDVLFQAQVVNFHVFMRLK